MLHHLSHSQCVFSRLFSHRDHNRFFSIKVLIVEKCLPSKEKKSIWCNDQDISGKKSSAFLTRFLVLITDFCLFFQLWWWDDIIFRSFWFCILHKIQQFYIQQEIKIRRFETLYHHLFIINEEIFDCEKSSGLRNWF